MTILDLPMDGSPIDIIIALDVNGDIEELEFDIICPLCGYDKYYVSMDKSFMSCAKCQTVIAKRNCNYFGEISWNLE